MVKRMPLNLFEVSRWIKPIMMFKLKEEDDELLYVSRTEGSETVIVTSNGYALRFNTEEIPVVGLKTSGVKSIKLDAKAYVTGAFVVSDSKEYVALFTDKNTAKRIKVDEIAKLTRAKKGTSIIKSPKSKTYNITRAFNTGSKSIFGVLDGEVGYMKASDVVISDKLSTGSSFTKKNYEEVFVVSKLVDITKETISAVKEEENIEKEEVVEKKETKTEKQLTMSDFFEEFKI
jgi:DNA gyrase/topoisomerase IV subunit A